MKTNIASRYPLRLIYIKRVEVASRIVEEYTVRLELAQYFMRLELLNVFQETALFISVDNMQLFFSNSAEVGKKLHSNTCHEGHLICRLAHLEKQLDLL